MMDSVFLFVCLSVIVLCPVSTVQGSEYCELNSVFDKSTNKTEYAFDHCHETCRQYCLPGDECFPNAETWHNELGKKLKNPASLFEVTHSTGAAILEKNCPKLPESGEAAAWTFLTHWNISYALQDNALGLCAQSRDCTKDYCDVNRDVGTGDGTENADYDAEHTLPAFTLAAESVEDVQAGIKFADKYNIKISVKSSGHSYSGSSTVAGSLQIWTRRMNKHAVMGWGTTTIKLYVSADLDFKEGSFTDTCGDNDKNLTVTKIPGGANWRETYGAVEAINQAREKRSTKTPPKEYMIVGGGGLTVSASGGWLLGGGLSPFIRWAGYGLDQAVEFSVILPNGTHVERVGKCSEPDLFWALKGGGGGAFGVVTHVLYKLHESQPVQTLSLTFDWPSIQLAGTNWKQAIGEPLVTAYLKMWVEKSITLDKRWGGYWDAMSFKSLYFYGSKTDAETTFFNYLNTTWLDSLGDNKKFVRLSLTSFKSYLHHRHSDEDYLGDPTGITLYGTDITGHSRTNLGSKLVPKQWLIDDPNAVVQMLTDIAVKLEAGAEMWNYFTGGDVGSFDTNSEKTSIHPDYFLSTNLKKTRLENLVFFEKNGVNSAPFSSTSTVRGIHPSFFQKNGRVFWTKS